MGWWQDWRRSRVIKSRLPDPALFQSVVDRLGFLSGLSDSESDRLRDLVALFLHEKSIHGAGGMEITEEIRVAIAVQACLVILELGLDSYRGWVEIVVYPDEFIAKYEFVDEAGVSHQVEEIMAGEAWDGGPVILSWPDAMAGGQGSGYNVVIHEFAHKLDMLNGEPNGFPPLHAGMDRQRWSAVFHDAYEHFSGCVDSGAELPMDEYAAESPAEFFAVASEAFFETPDVLHAAYPAVYEQLRCFYRQDPGARFASAVRGTVSG